MYSARSQQRATKTRPSVPRKLALTLFSQSSALKDRLAIALDSRKRRQMLKSLEPGPPTETPLVDLVSNDGLFLLFSSSLRSSRLFAPPVSSLSPHLPPPPLALYHLLALSFLLAPSSFPRLPSILTAARSFRQPPSSATPENAAVFCARPRTSESTAAPSRPLSSSYSFLHHRLRLLTQPDSYPRPPRLAVPLAELDPTSARALSPPQLARTAERHLLSTLRSG